MQTTFHVQRGTETITVTDAPPLITTESADISHNFAVDRLDNLPVLTVGTGRFERP